MFSQDFDIYLYARSLKCPLHIASYALRSEYPSSSCEALNFSLAIHFNASVTFLLRVLEIL